VCVSEYVPVFVCLCVNVWVCECMCVWRLERESIHSHNHEHHELTQLPTHPLTRSPTQSLTQASLYRCACLEASAVMYSLWGGCALQPMSAMGVDRQMTGVIQEYWLWSASSIAAFDCVLHSLADVLCVRLSWLPIWTLRRFTVVKRSSWPSGLHIFHIWRVCALCPELSLLCQ